MKILLIQSRIADTRLSRERANIARSLGGGHDISYVSTLNDALSWQDPEAILNQSDAVIIGGSGDFDLDGGRDPHDPAQTTSRTILERVAPLVEHLISTQTPTLGICYGHQLIAELYGGRVVHDRDQMKIGSHEVITTSSGDPLFEALPARFIAQYGHKDSVTALPRGAELVAKGEQCAYSALRYGERVYTTQFHPELTADDIRARISSMSGYLPGRIATEDDVKDSHDASRIISQFIALASGSRT